MARQERRKPQKGTGPRIRRKIEKQIWKDFQPGARLRQEVLAESLGVSQGTVREALLELTVTGIVKIEEGQGFSLVDFQTLVRMILDGYDLRISLESFAAKRSADNKIDAMYLEPLFAMADEIYQLSKTDTLDEMAALERKWHISLVRLAGNALLNDLMTTHWVLGKTIRTERQASAAHAKQTFDAHRAILDAIKDHKGDKAAELVTAHIQENRDAFQAHLKWGGPLVLVPPGDPDDSSRVSVLRLPARSTV